MTQSKQKGVNIEKPANEFREKDVKNAKNDKKNLKKQKKIITDQTHRPEKQINSIGKTQSKNQTKTEINAYDSSINKLVGFYSKYIIQIWLAVIFIPIMIITLGYLFFPEIFYDQFIWKYFWGTIEADANEKSYGEVTEAYNPVNTIFYAFIVLIVLYWIYKLFKKYHINLDYKFFIAVIPFIVVGGAARALEDAELFTGPVVYFFIAPIIYIIIGLMVLGFILIAVGIQYLFKRMGDYYGLLLIATVFIGLDVFYLFTYILIGDQFSYMLHPIVPILISLVFIYLITKYTKINRQFDTWSFLFFIGLWFLIICIIILYQWQSISSWNEAYSAANPNKTITLRPAAFLLVLGLTSFAVLIVYVIAKLLSIKHTQLIPFLFGTNLIIFFGHFLDASATFIALDYYGYTEKHVLPSFLIDIFHTAAIMYVLKGVIIVLVVYFIDIAYKKDFQNNPLLTGLVKIAILVLGLAPGLRDVLRLGIGV